MGSAKNMVNCLPCLIIAIDDQMVFDVEIQFIKWGLEDLGIKLPTCNDDHPTQRSLQFRI